MTTQNSAVYQLQRTAPTTFRIIPAGYFSASDGRQNGNWFLSESSARAIIATANQRKEDYLIDYDHQSLSQRTNNQIAAAAGWFKKLEWRTDGLYVTDARWTPRAKAMIEANEYRYISPVFGFTKATGVVNDLISVGLTNSPALPGLTDLAVAAASAKFNSLENGMTEEELQRYRWMFGGSPDELAAAIAERERPPNMPGLEGMNEKDKANFQHVFGHLYKP